MLIQKKTKTCFVIDVACPFDTRLRAKELEKIEHYNDLKYEIMKVWKNEVKKVIIVPIIIGALGSVTKNLRKYLETISFDKGIEPLQKCCLLGNSKNSQKIYGYRVLT